MNSMILLGINKWAPFVKLLKKRELRICKNYNKILIQNKIELGKIVKCLKLD